MPQSKGLSFIVPAYNEELGISETINELKEALLSLNIDYEIIVVNDASKDNTAAIVASISGVSLVNHPINMGYGKSIKTGLLRAKYGWVGIIDADGTYPAYEIPKLVDKMEEGFDMVVACRSNIGKHDSSFKHIARHIYQFLVNLLSGHRIKDPNSGLRILRYEIAMEFFEFLCDRFSFTTSLSILAAMKPYFIDFIDIDYQVRKGATHVRHFRDSLFTLRVIIEGVTYYNPLKFFFLLAILMIWLVGFPAMLFAVFNMHTLSGYYMIFGCTTAMLIGIGVLADVVRTSSTKSYKRLHQQHDHKDLIDNDD